MGGGGSPSLRNDTVESACAGKLQVTCKVPLVGHSLFERRCINAQLLTLTLMPDVVLV